MHLIEGRIGGLRCAHLHYADDPQAVEQVLARFPLAEVHACSPRMALTLERWCLRVRGAGALHLDLQAACPSPPPLAGASLVVNGAPESGWTAGRGGRCCHAGRWGWQAWQRLREATEVFHAVAGTSHAVCAAIQQPPLGARILFIAAAGEQASSLRAWLETVVATTLREAGRVHLVWCAPSPPLGPLASAAVPLPHHRTLLLARSGTLRCLARRRRAVAMPSISIARLPVPSGA